MAKKENLDDLVFCDQCGGSIPAETKPFVVERPDGSSQSLCQECLWAAKSEEEQPSLALDDNITIDASALQSIRRPEGSTEDVVVAAEVEEEPEEEEDVAGAPAGASYRHCKTFISQVTPQALDFLDNHMTDFIRQRKIRIKHATTCYGMAGIGAQGSRVDALFVTLWW